MELGVGYICFVGLSLGGGRGISLTPLTLSSLGVFSSLIFLYLSLLIFSICMAGVYSLQ